jgi:hypothetical protein
VSANECPVDGCSNRRETNQLMCRKHWYKVPRELRHEVWAAAKKMWNDDPDVETAYQNWRELADTAIGEVELQEKEAA